MHPTNGGRRALLPRPPAGYAGPPRCSRSSSIGLGGAVALRLASDRSGGGARIAGIVPIAPAGLEMPRWFGAVDRDPIVRTLLSLPTPVPEAVVRALVGRAYRLLVFGDQAAARPELVAAFTRHHRTPAVVADYLSTARRMLPEHGRLAQEIRVNGLPASTASGEGKGMLELVRGRLLAKPSCPDPSTDSPGRTASTMVLASRTSGPPNARALPACARAARGGDRAAPRCRSGRACARDARPLGRRG